MDNPFLKLTVTDRQILNSYALMLNGLGAYLGDGYELVLHSLESLDHTKIDEKISSKSSALKL